MTRFGKYSSLLLLTLSLGIAPQSAIAGFVCWTNNEGMKECGNNVPPEYAQKETRKRDAQGRVTEIKKRAKTPAEIAAEKQQQERRAKREAIAKRKKDEQARQDQVLLGTYTSERDIISARDRQLTSMEGSITLAQASIKKQEKILDVHRKRAGSLERDGRPVPDELKADMGAAQQQIRNKQNFIQSKRQDQEILRNKYAADILRFRKLMEQRRH